MLQSAESLMDKTKLVTQLHLHNTEDGDIEQKYFDEQKEKKKHVILKKVLHQGWMTRVQRFARGRNKGACWVYMG